MEKVRIGNDIQVKYTVLRDGQPESFVGATNIVVTVKNEAYGKIVPSTFSILNNIVTISLDAADCVLCGKHRVTLSYNRGNDITIDALAFELVQFTSLTGGTEIVGVEIVTVNISGDIGIAIPDNNKIDLDGLNSNIDKLHFKPDTLVQLSEVGDVRYSPESKTLEVKVSDTVSIQLGQEMQTRVKNNAGVQINNGQLVYIDSAAGANPLAKIASTTDADIAQRTFGMATENIASNGFGAITTEGLVRDINTSAFPEGAMLWLGVNGAVTNIEPVAPTPKISVGMVLRSNNQNGVIYVKIRAIARNQKLSDVYAPTLTGGDVLRWNSTTLRFETFNVTTALSGKVNTTGNETIAGVKTFSSSPVIPAPTTDLQAATKKYVDDSTVGISGNETVTGIKTFQSSPIVPTPTTDMQATTKKYVDDADASLRADLNIFNYMYPSVQSAKRITTDLGVIRSKSNYNDLTNKFVDLLPNTKFLYCPQLAVKLRTTGIYNYVTKLYDIGTDMIDGVQTTALNQPYLTGNIAPNEKYGVKNPNGASTYLMHSPISFLSTDKWTVSTMLNDFCNNLTTSGCYAGNGSGNSNIYLRHNSANRVRFLSNAAVDYLFNVNNSMIGKNSMVTLVANGLGGLSLYINGRLFQSIASTDTSAVFSQFVNGSAIGTSNFSGVIYYHAVRNIQMSPTQIDEEYQYIRSLYPEMRSVKIGTQEWAVINAELTCTPMGNLMPEVQLNTAWADSTNVYNTTYAATSGTAEQKEYAAVKAAAMWCYYNNDPVLGAIYGKLYNWYAVKLLQMDIDYYNVANPTTPWGWKVPTNADFIILSNYLGGNSASGGKLRKDGLIYWSAPNAGADNSSGFSVVGSGSRDASGIFSFLLNIAYLRSVDKFRLYTEKNTPQIVITSAVDSFGYSLRLIKA